MKKLCFILALLLSFFAKADCSRNGISIFPSVDNIKPNSVFILEGYDLDSKIIFELNKNYTVYLENNKKKVKLLVQDICFGSHYLAQAYLKPETNLEVGKEYILYVEGFDGKKNTKKFIKYYKVVQGNDTEKPSLKADPKEVKKSFVEAGCGDEAYVIFDVPTQDDSEIIVKTTVKALATGSESIYYLPLSDKNKIAIGYGMCSGEFDFEEGIEYEVNFILMDASGNKSKPSQNIKFTSPKTS